MEGLPDGMEMVGGWRRGNTEGPVINSVSGLGGWRGGGQSRGGQSRGGQSRGGQSIGGQS
jgi:hypothetical protein